MSTEITPSMRRSILIAALRNEELQEGHEWNFCHYPGCAVGLANKLFHFGWSVYVWGTRNAEGQPIEELVEMAKLFGTDEAFGFSNYTEAPERVTPFMVADRLEALHNAMAER